MYPFTCARAVGAAPTVTLSRTEEVSQGKTEAQDNQSNAKAKATKRRRAKQVAPARPLLGAASTASASPLPGHLTHTSGAGHLRAYQRCKHV